MSDLADPNAMYSRAELEAMLVAMKATSDIFYGMATRIGNHPFIEFCGLMNEYIACCRKTLAAGPKRIEHRYGSLSWPFQPWGVKLPPGVQPTRRSFH